MEASHCPQLVQHRRTHQDFVRRVGELKTRYENGQTSALARECLTFLNSWLINHICTTDMGYRAWVIGHTEAMQVGADQHLTGENKTSAVTDWRRLKILVVDDNINFCEILTTILRGVGVPSVAVVHDVAAAKAVLETGEADLVISDWHVGTDNGLDLVKWIRRGPPTLNTLPVLMLSGHERLVNRDVALLAGADEFMEKPISARGLLICLGRLAARKRQ